jgi:ribonuclease BN (tRNA processing enzyme)
VKSPQDNNNCIKFLGTAGARVVVARQLRSSAGTFIQLNGTKILLDPGPGTLVRMAGSKPTLDASKLDAIILTHRHIDHSTDINVMIEAMSEGGFRKRGVVFAPQDSLEAKTP